MDVGAHILSAKFKVVANDFAMIIPTLYENKVISLKTKKGLAEISKFRNLLAHGYLKIDYDKLYAYAKKSLKHIEQFEIEIIRFINKHK